jgi:gliding motility-associated-like protein
MRIFLPLLLIFSVNLIGQNLVYNPSFENLSINCCDYPLGSSPFFMLENWTNANNPAGYAMADLSHRCLSCAIPSYSLPENAPFGDQNPRTGDAFAGQFVFDFINYPPMSSEYIQGEIQSPLQANITYTISFWVSLAALVNYTYSNYSIYFTNSQLNENSLFLDYFTPQITTNSYITETEGWQNIKIQFTAQGGEKYFSFGTFLPYDQLDTIRIGCADYDSLHPNSCYDVCYLYLDDVAIYPADAPVYEADAGGDQLLCIGESATLGSASRSQYLYWWYDEQGNLIDTTALITVSPDSTTFYVLQQKDFKFDETSDTVVVYVSDCEDPLYIPNIFSPNADGKNDVFRVRGEGISEIKTFLIYNRWGEEVFKCHTERSRSAALEDCGWDGTCRGEPAPQAVYTYYVEAVLLNGETVVKRGNVTLVR